MNIRKLLVGNIVFYTGGFQEFVNFIVGKFKSDYGNKLIIVHINLRNYYYLYKVKKLKESIKNDCVCVLDGIGMKIAVMLRRHVLVPDLNGTDLFPLLIKSITTLNYGIFLLGADEGIIKITAKKIQEKYPGINLCGYHSGYFSEGEENDVIEKINNSKSDILIIGRGFPLQEQFVLKYKDSIRSTLIWNVGGLFDILSGSKPRAPKSMRKLRLEWLYRFLLEPSRMLHRNTVAALWSFFHVILNVKGFLK
jgi:N-acetylglucosaminyldiphosphoundecaprenol N-acetyl-beta-D-mannosaminyltransferase